MINVNSGYVQCFGELHGHTDHDEHSGHEDHGVDYGCIYVDYGHLPHDEFLDKELGIGLELDAKQCSICCWNGSWTGRLGSCHSGRSFGSDSVDDI